MHPNTRCHWVDTRPTPTTNLSIPLSLRAFPLPLRPSEKARGRLYAVYMGETRVLILAQLHLCLRKVHPNIRLQSLRAIRILQAVSFKRSIARLIYAVVICFIHFATTPSTNLSIPLACRLFPLPLRPSEKARGAFMPYLRGKLEF